MQQHITPDLFLAFFSKIDSYNKQTNHKLFNIMDPNFILLAEIQQNIITNQ